MKELGPIKRMHTTDCAYVAHYIEQEQTKVLVKKLTEATIKGEGTELETVDDNFEVLAVGRLGMMQGMRPGSTSS